MGFGAAGAQGITRRLKDREARGEREKREWAWDRDERNERCGQFSGDERGYVRERERERDREWSYRDEDKDRDRERERSDKDDYRDRDRGHDIGSSSAARSPPPTPAPHPAPPPTTRINTLPSAHFLLLLLAHLVRRLPSLNPYPQKNAKPLFGQKPSGVLKRACRCWAYLHQLRPLACLLPITQGLDTSVKDRLTQEKQEAEEKAREAERQRVERAVEK